MDIGTTAKRLRWAVWIFWAAITLAYVFGRLGVETDFLFPLEQQEEIATLLRKAGRTVRFEALPSIQGHDSFLVDMDRFRPVIGDFLKADLR